ncbi:MAG: glycosyltransferase family 9 protein [Pantoea sp.]|uniref:Glycosyltransferase n=1 Tax=Pantoea brenneri TaxID=472694 RepID=A0AAX3J0T0_9GAMM|nr:MULTISPECIES: glycosyltransferase family 9 protein [Pantoea]MBS6033248.1 glycosyltransferase family 9 protein [Pantoea sp.]MDH2123808.1 glycosyltransferase family 9 protein [Pantoea brenneri]VXB13180.1 Glycosyltransferase [Pantoea brenneri]
MNYVLIYLLLVPFRTLMRLFYRPTGRNLIIQTAKIGDFINITPMLRALGQSELLISKAVEPLVRHDDTVSRYFLIEEAKRSFFAKLKLAFILMNRYDNVYLVQPNSVNLFFASLCNAPNKQFLRTYVRKSYHTVFYRSASGIMDHAKTDLTLDSYLKLINREYRYTDFPKHATSPLWQPPAPPAALLTPREGIKIGISISAGNRAKTIPASVWQQLMEALADLPCTFYVFGPPAEQPWLDELLSLTGPKENIVSLIGELKLEEVPWAIAQMDFYISSDSGNAYIADAQQIPLIVLYGPCDIREQRPVHNALFIGPDNIAATSFIFAAPYAFDQPAEKLFELDHDKLTRIQTFITHNLE